MMQFHCSYQWDDGSSDVWYGTVDQVVSFGSHYEIFILSRSSLRVMVGESSSGLFACLPDYGAGCHLSTLDDTFYNSEKLIRALDNAVDGTTIAYALKALEPGLKFN
ncbi:MAG TPA: hypothetical protein GXZ29_08700 [Clostridiales bacterium]|jgi:hypothetical protein|nr:hypothetical protein [Clostridiales bacterium]